MQKCGVNVAKQKPKDGACSKASRLKLLSVPQKIMPNMPFIELRGNREALIEGCKGILEYDTQVIRVNTGSMVVSFCGRGLNIKCLTVSSLIVEGYITSVEFVN